MSITCSLGLITECALLLYGAFGSNTLSSVVALILLLIVEVIPAIALVATMKQPPNPAAPEGLVGDLCWFCYAEGTYFGMGSASAQPRDSRRASERNEANEAPKPADKTKPSGSEAAPLPPSRTPSSRDPVVETPEMRLSQNLLRGDDDEESLVPHADNGGKRGSARSSRRSTAESKLDSPFFDQSDSD